MLQISFVGRMAFVEGYVGQLRQPSVQYVIKIHGKADAGFYKRLIHLTERRLGLPEDSDFVANPDYIAIKISRWMTRLLERNNHPVCQDALIKATGKNLFKIIQPCIHCRETAQVLISLLMLMTGDKRGPDYHANRISELLTRTQLGGFNQFHFVKNSHELNIPWQIMNGGIALLGWGANSRWLDSSFTDRTPSISAKIARNKYWASSFLRKAGIPVPPHVLVKNEDDLRRGVEELGFPLVVKPADQDGGLGVKAHLMSAEEVVSAYQEVNGITDRILLEKHVPGDDYRLQVVNGEVQGVLARRPGGILGDGVNDVLQLVQIQNQERKDAQDDRKYLHPIEIDTEAENQLKSQGLGWDSIVQEGQFVRLRGACNVASGGVPEEIPLDEVHPDNKFLAINAANLLRLDVAGIDLLIPDIATSWHESGAYICEVNAQPQMFTSMHGPMLKNIFGGTDGRIPIVLFLGRRPSIQQLQDLSAKIEQKGLVAGYHTGNESWIGRNCIQRSERPMFESIKMLTVNRAVQCILFGVDSLDEISGGWPVDKVDFLVIDKTAVAEGDEDNGGLKKLVSAVAHLGSKPTVFCAESVSVAGDIPLPTKWDVTYYQSESAEIHDALVERIFGKVTAYQG